LKYCSGLHSSSKQSNQIQDESNQDLEKKLSKSKYFKCLKKMTRFDALITLVSIIFNTKVLFVCLQILELQFTNFKQRFFGWSIN